MDHVLTNEEIAFISVQVFLGLGTRLLLPSFPCPVLDLLGVS